MTIAFDPEKAVIAYRQAIAKRDSETDKKKRSAAQATALRLRAEWKESNGDDELHKLAFGEPEE
jgi:hypothetical protein